MSESIWADPWLLGGLMLVWGSLVVAIVVVFRAQKDARRIANVLPETITSAFAGGSATAELGDFPLRLAKEYVTTTGDRIIVRRNPSEIISTAITDEFDARAWLAAGSAFTGMALVITFLLIGGVLFWDVGPAIESSLSALDAPTGGLSSAVGKMGAKFFISASGVAAALVHRLIVELVRRRVRAAASQAASIVAPSLISMDALRVEHDQATAQSLSMLNGEMARGFTTLSKDIQALGTIEVSVKDLGTKVSDSLGTLMKDALAEQLRTLLEDMKESGVRIQEDIQRFADDALRRTSEEIVHELKGLNETLSNQSGTQLEQLMEKLQDIVTGGFSSASRNMSAQVEQFGDVLPRIGEQMESVTSRFEAILGQLRDQQEQGSKTIAALADSTRVHTDQFAQSLAESGSQALGQVLGEAAGQVRALVDLLRDGLQASSSASDSTRQHMTEASEAMLLALSESRSTAVVLQQQMKEIAQGMTATSQTGTALTQSAMELTRTTHSLQKTVASIGEVSGDVSALLKTQQDTQTRQLELLHQMQSVWPPLLEQVASKVKESTQALGSTWSDAAEKLDRLTSGHIHELQESVEDFKVSVEKMHTAARDGELRRGAR